MLPSASRTCQSWSRELLPRFATAQCCPRSCRAISTNSAIARGLRETSAADRSYAGTKERPLFREELKEYDRRRSPLWKEKNRARYEKKRLERKTVDDWEARAEEAPTVGEEGDLTLISSESAPADASPGPLSIPHTTAASQFIYGSSAVRAALTARRRKCYKLYVHDRALRREVHPAKPDRAGSPDSAEVPAGTLLRMAQTIPNLEVKMVGDSFLPVMDQMSNGRPHNGVVLDASPLPTIPIVQLRASQRDRPYFSFELDKQTPEQAELNNRVTRLPYNSHGWRYPFVLFLDGIVDQGNMGALIRSAYYFGVDAVAITTRGTAAIDTVALKASSGAAEAIPIFTVSNPLGFLTRSNLSGWRLYAADAPAPLGDNFNVTSDHVPRALDPTNASPLLTFTRPHSLAVLHEGHSPLLQHPTILMLGGERLGFRTSIRARANYLVGIRGVRGLDVGVDSLNVSVAGAVIMLELLRKPKLADKVVEAQRRRIRNDGRNASPENGKPQSWDDSIKNDEMLF